jgi:hypothetical protein
MTDTTYPKINGLYKRDEKGRIIEGDYSRPEFAYLRDLPWLWLEKVDGCSMRLIFDGTESFDVAPERYVAGRTDNAQIPPKLLQACANILRDSPFSAVFPDAAPDDENRVVLYGEGYGAGIQKGGGNYRPDQGFVLFDCRVGPWWLSRANVEDVAAKLGIDVVPLVNFGTTHGDSAPIDVAESFVVNDWIKSAWPGVERPEGLVGRPTVPLFDNKGERITVKIKWRDYA